ncbi:unnamed protein product [Lactuca virosa]|uniref:Uncharacterized protein n=1 Tax=Lactuca virosa TaxID=75947 RepID=A0AAU9MKI5_9ASTR|nr:unnamed protein product [Lactuca virosa]
MEGQRTSSMVNRTGRKEHNMKSKVKVKKFDADKDSDSTSKKKIKKQTGWNESVDRIPENAIQRENELRTKKQFDSCKRKGLKVVVLNSYSSQSMSMGTCDLSMLSKVIKDMDLSDIDWYGYVFDCLKDTRSAWNPYNRKGFYVGPIIFLLLLYVESVRCDSVKIVRGLVMGEMQEPFQVINESADTGNIVHDTVQANKAGEGVKLSDGSFKANLSTIKEMHVMLMHKKQVLEDKINEAVKKYPENPLVQEWKKQIK